MTRTDCANCGEPMAGPICASCGQRAAERLAVGRIAGELKEQLVGLDIRLLRTAWEVLTTPGSMISGYLTGRRIRYTNPFKFLFLAATLYLLVVTLLDVQLSPSSRGRETATVVVTLVNYLVFVFLLPCAGLLQLLFRRRRLNWAESYVVLCYVWGGYLLVAAGLAVPMAIFDRWYFYARTAAGLAFVTFCLRRLFGVGWVSAAWKGTLFYAGYFLATFLTMAALIALSYLLGIEALRLPMGRGP